ncbi:MAG TPA: prolyl oligopeptidase family serine peptidase [Gemmataceae bacterium]|nr:prolyl oligopeptidase family serine peptidase [Gemmataceae bacterium]
MTALTLTLCLLPAAHPHKPHEPAPVEWTVDGVKRHALVFAPKHPSANPPLVFAFHGHGGSAKESAQHFHIQHDWPEAVVVYMQGLHTKGRTDPEGEQSGWQGKAGDEHDRDLKFFDAVLATMREKYHVDERRVYATGHSAGGHFTYLLATARPDVWAAIAPSAAANKLHKGFHPVPVFQAAGKKDTTIPFDQQLKTIEELKAVNGCDSAGTHWAKDCTLYPSTKGAPVVAFIHNGTHAYPHQAPALIVKVFREHARGK